jgi:hypothetical protein
MDQRMEQQWQDMISFSEKSMQTVINQVPLVVQSIFSSMGRIYNVQPLQLQAPLTSQPPFMFTEGIQTPQGSGSFTHAELTLVGTTSAIQRAYSPLNLEAMTSMAPLKAIVASVPSTDELPDKALEPTDSVAGCSL